MLTESTGKIFTKITESGDLAATSRETETWAERVAENGESSFLLDWLAGGVACSRNIQGFSFKFENLGVAAPQ